MVLLVRLDWAEDVTREVIVTLNSIRKESTAEGQTEVKSVR